MASFQLQTARLLLRDVTADDETPLVAYLAEDAAQPHILSWQKRPELRQLLVRGAAAVPPLPLERRKHFLLAIQIGESGELAGVCTLTYAEPGSTYAQLGWHLAQAHSGKGYAAEAGHEVLRLAFEHRGVRRVNADCFGDNPRVPRVLSKLGMKHRQLSRFRNWWLQTAYGEEKPIVRYSIDATDWREQTLPKAVPWPAQQSVAADRREDAAPS